MRVSLIYEGVKVSVDPDKDTSIFKSMRNPPFLQERTMEGIDVFVRILNKYKFFYAVKWDLTKEECNSYHILTHKQAQKLVTSLKEDDYLGYMNKSSQKCKITYYNLQSQTKRLK